LGIRHPELTGTPAEPADAHAHTHSAHAPAWIMSAPVAVLIPFSIGIGWLGAGGEHSPWRAYFAPLFGSAIEPAAPISELLSGVIVLAVVAVGIVIAYVRYGTKTATTTSVERLRAETVRMPGVLVNAYYFDAAIDALIVRPAAALGRLLGNTVDPVVIDGGVREVAHSAAWLGHFFRSFQTGLVRGYALYIVFGVASFAVYYAVIGSGR
jgi:NADH-quinone oxidoreductase subunit L